MADCDGYFDQYEIPFLPEYEDAAVYAVRSAPDLSIIDKKVLILCWYDVTFGQWNGFRFDLGESRVRMTKWLTASPYATYEAFLED